MKVIEWFIELYVGIILIVINLYFFIFVHYKYDYAPNFALGIVTIPFGIYKIIKCIKNQPKKNTSQQNQTGEMR